MFKNLLFQGLSYFVGIKFIDYLQTIDGDPHHPMDPLSSKSLLKTALQATTLVVINKAVGTSAAK